MGIRRIVLAIAAIALGASLANAQTYHVRDLGSLGGLGDVEAFDLSGTGPVLAGFATGGDQHHTAFVWNGSTLIPILPLSGDSQSAAFGVDGQGRVVGISYTLGEPVVHAFRWDQGVVSQLGSFTPRSINAAGDIVGSLSLTDPWGLRAQHACILPMGAATPIDLGTLFGSNTSYANAINGRGEVVGISAGPGDQGTRAALWFQGIKIDMGTLGGNSSAAYAINDFNLAVGWSDAGGSTPTNRATKFILDSNGFVVSRVNMGVLPPSAVGGGTWSYAYGVNNAAWVVGQSNGRGFVDFGQGLRDMNALIPAAPAWFVASARAIDDAGNVAGWGVDALGRPRPLLFVPCDGDFDRNGSVTVSDIFSYLGAWFASDPSADALHDGFIRVSDIFAFLSRWFAGCPF